ncbi:MAG: protein-L-isoaspartate(D-aspartate) O-methyltransferase [Candidatus Poribacteria bacterium]|nr:protein-L-isoaspartate(D-aspartate) O-methyltransferase [Candidatus Poribacteria bacterium]
MDFRRQKPKNGTRPARDHYAGLREKMVREQIQRRGVKDKRVLEVMRKIPRHLFVDPDNMDFAYEDNAMPIQCEQTISQPYIVALMTELLELDGCSKVLEIGTGCGYQTAVLAKIAAQVYTVEIIPELAEISWKRLDAFGYQNIHKKLGNGYRGWQEHAPYDRITVTAAPEKVPDCLIEQLAEGGCMILPIGDLYQDLVRIRKTEDGIERETITGVRFVPMTGAPA